MGPGIYDPPWCSRLKTTSQHFIWIKVSFRAYLCSVEEFVSTEPYQNFFLTFILIGLEPSVADLIGVDPDAAPTFKKNRVRPFGKRPASDAGKKPGVELTRIRIRIWIRPRKKRINIRPSRKKNRISICTILKNGSSTSSSCQKLSIIWYLYFLSKIIFNNVFNYIYIYFFIKWICIFLSIMIFNNVVNYIFCFIQINFCREDLKILSNKYCYKKEQLII